MNSPETEDPRTEAAGSTRDSGVARFDCCDTEFEVLAWGQGADEAAALAQERALSLERRLNAFDDESAVARLNREGRVEDPHVAEIVGRAEEYRRATDGAFDVRLGEVERSLKSYIAGETDAPPAFDDVEDAYAAEVSVDGDIVTADGPLDLNGLAKGYVVDQVLESLEDAGASGFVNGGGDMTPPHGPVAVESPYEEEEPVEVLDTPRYVATSGGYRRGRGDVEHIYDPRRGETGVSHDSVTVTAERDCVEADSLATAASVLPVEDAISLLSDWSGADALIAADGRLHTTPGFAEDLYSGGIDG